MQDADSYKREVSLLVIWKALPVIYWLCQHEAPQMLICTIPWPAPPLSLHSMLPLQDLSRCQLEQRLSPSAHTQQGDYFPIPMSAGWTPKPHLTKSCYLTLVILLLLIPEGFLFFS